MASAEELHEERGRRERNDDGERPGGGQAEPPGPGEDLLARPPYRQNHQRDDGENACGGEDLLTHPHLQHTGEAHQQSTPPRGQRPVQDTEDQGGDQRWEDGHRQVQVTGRVLGDDIGREPVDEADKE